MAFNGAIARFSFGCLSLVGMLPTHIFSVCCVSWLALVVFAGPSMDAFLCRFFVVDAFCVGTYVAFC